VELDAVPPAGQRVAVLARALGTSEGGNLLFANGPGEAETFAEILFNSLGPDADADSELIRELTSASREIVHERYVLARFARRGIGVHYGSMPQTLRSLVEKGFDEGELKWLVSTSTLLEGVNLSCRNIFVRNPKKGDDKMDLADFWNLAGRAGRLGREFSGNVFCIDTREDKYWPEPPVLRRRSPIRSALIDTLHDASGIAEYLRDGAPSNSARFSSQVESTLSLLVSKELREEPISSLWDSSSLELSPDRIAQLARDAAGEIRMPAALVTRNAGVSPLAMQRLHDFINSVPNVKDAALVSPHADDAFEVYDAALELVGRFFAGSFVNTARRMSLSRLIVHWIRGVPLRVIIDNRVDYRRRNGLEIKLPSLIRSVMSDVENVARYEAPKYLACYSDVVAEVARERGLEVEESGVDLALLLELGVPRLTEVSFIGLGLTRSTTMALTETLTRGNISEAEALSHLRALDLEGSLLPSYARREITSLLISYRDRDS
jgi:hypothetical protein